MPTAGIPVIVAVPLPLSVKFTPVGNAPVLVRPAVGFPVVVTVKVPVDPTVNVALFPLVMEGGTCTVMDVVDVTDAGVVAVFVTVRV